MNDEGAQERHRQRMGRQKEIVDDRIAKAQIDVLRQEVSSNGC